MVCVGLRGGNATTLSSLFLVRTSALVSRHVLRRHSFITIITSAVILIIAIIIGALTGVFFYSFIISRSIPNVRTDDRNGANRLVGYIIFNFYRWLAFLLLFLLFLSSFLTDKLRRQYHAGVAVSIIILFYSWGGLVWYVC